MFSDLVKNYEFTLKHEGEWVVQASKYYPTYVGCFGTNKMYGSCQLWNAATWPTKEQTPVFLECEVVQLDSKPALKDLYKGDWAYVEELEGLAYKSIRASYDKEDNTGGIVIETDQHVLEYYAYSDGEYGYTPTVSVMGELCSNSTITKLVEDIRPAGVVLYCTTLAGSFSIEITLEGAELDTARISLWKKLKEPEHV